MKSGNRVSTVSQWCAAAILVTAIFGCGGGNNDLSPKAPGAGTGTGLAGGHGPAPVNLASSANYVILAKSGVSNVPTSTITGNIGLSPMAATGITGFALTMDAGGTFSTSAQVTGHLFAADYAGSTPAQLTSAVTDMQAAYVDASVRSAVDFNELAGGNIGGLTLPAGNYKWSTAVTIPKNMVLTGGPNDVWIFQIGGGLSQSNGTVVTLLGGALAQNVYWQVAGVVNIGSTAHMEGELMSNSAITMQTGASANGRLLAQTAVTMQSNTVVQK